MSSNIENIKKVGLCSIDYCDIKMTEIIDNHGFLYFIGGLILFIIGMLIFLNPDIHAILNNMSAGEGGQIASLTALIATALKLLICGMVVSGFGISVAGWSAVFNPHKKSVDGYYVFLHNENGHLLTMTSFKKSTDNQENIKLMKEKVEFMEKLAEKYNQKCDKKMQDEQEMITEVLTGEHESQRTGSTDDATNFRF